MYFSVHVYPSWGEGLREAVLRIRLEGQRPTHDELTQIIKDNVDSSVLTPTHSYVARVWRVKSKRTKMLRSPRLQFSLDADMQLKIL